MNYTLNNEQQTSEKSPLEILKKITELVRDEKKPIFFALIANILTSGLTLLGPWLVGYAITRFIVTGNYKGVITISVILVSIYIVALIAHYIQVKTMGSVGQRVLFSIRNKLFDKISELPVAFFNQNKAGDLISRINNDTEKLNQFFSQVIMQFIGNFFIIIGAAIFLLAINFKLGLLVLTPAILLFVATRILSSWIQSRNKKALQSMGNVTTEVQQSLNNFKAIVVFNRQDYFREKFDTINESNKKITIQSGISNTILTPMFDFMASSAQVLLLGYGLLLVIQGQLALGFFISFLSYVNRFYDPLRQMAALWATFQTAFAAWDRVSEIFSLETNLEIEHEQVLEKNTKLLEFKNVSLVYEDTKKSVLHNVSFSLESGKKYAFVGPTGGGKTTTASLIARLLDPTEGTIFFQGKKLSSLSEKERSQKIGFILQDPFLFSGTVYENLVYSNEKYNNLSEKDLLKILHHKNLEILLQRFPQGLSTKITGQSQELSLGQRQLIAFMRAVLRDPDILILDEATANIDTVTEQLLELVLQKLPKTTTQIIIAHRLNTIAHADQIFFINDEKIISAGTLDHAIDMLLNKNKKS